MGHPAAKLREGVYGIDIYHTSLYSERKPRRTRTFLLLSLTMFFLLLGVPHRTQAAPGDLDAGFGTTGSKILPLTPYSIDSYSVPVAIQSDGKIVLGTTLCCRNGNDFFFITRLNSDGSLDDSFGVAGKVSTRVGSSDAILRSLQIQADGKIIAVGMAEVGFTSSFAIARFDQKGTLDTSFGPTGNGTLTTQFPPSKGGEADSTAIQPDQKIVVAGLAIVSTHQVFAISRYLPNGGLDASFGSGGKILSPPISGGVLGIPSVALQVDNRIVVAGGDYLGTTTVFALARYDSSGNLDNSFGPSRNGTLVTATGTSVSFQKLAIQPDGKIILAGSSSAAGFTLARYTPAGDLDSSFAQMGIDAADVGGTLNAVALQPDGKIVGAGTVSITGQNELVVARFYSDGSLDDTFGVGGKVTNPNCTGARDIAIQTDGRILVTMGAAGSDLCLVRYLGDPNPVAPEPKILGLQPLQFYGLLGGGVAVASIGSAFSLARRRKTPTSPTLKPSPVQTPTQTDSKGVSDNAPQNSALPKTLETAKKKRLPFSLPGLPHVTLPKPIVEHRVPLALVTTGTALLVAALASISPQAGLFGGLVIPGILLLGMGCFILFLQLYQRPMGVRRFCMFDGFPMSNVDLVCPNCHRQPMSGIDTKVCQVSACSAVIPAQANYCGVCGAGQPRQA